MCAVRVQSSLKFNIASEWRRKQARYVPREAACGIFGGVRLEPFRNSSTGARYSLASYGSREGPFHRGRYFHPSVLPFFHTTVLPSFHTYILRSLCAATYVYIIHVDLQCHATYVDGVACLVSWCRSR